MGLAVNLLGTRAGDLLNHNQLLNAIQDVHLEEQLTIA